MKLTIDRDLPIPIGVQLRGLIEFGIACGELRPGERLPSVRELADQLGVAPMTVAQVYRELKEKGLIQSRAGSGTFAADAGQPTAGADRDVAGLHRRIDTLIDEALAIGLKPGDLTGLIAARIAERQSRSRRTDIVMAGNFPAATAAYAEAIAALLGPGVTVEPMTIDAIAADPAVRRRAAAADIVLTLSHRRHEVVAALPGAVIAAISFIPSEATRRALASLDPLARVLVVSIFPEFTPMMKGGVQRFAPHVSDITVTLRDVPELDRLLAAADVVVYATGADALAERLRPGAIAFEYRHTPDPGDLRRVVTPMLEATASRSDKLPHSDNLGKAS